MSKTAIVIPARWSSTRLPGKPLLPLAGKPIVQHVWERCRKVRGADAVIVATDDMRIAEVAFDFGAEVAMTSPKHPSGTDRIAEVAKNLAGFDIVLNVQGDEPFILHPGEFVLGSTYEVVTLPDDVAGRLEGKSSLGRLGLLTHSTAGFIDPGFSGHVTLELSNVATLPIKLYPGMKIGQLCLFRLSSPAEHPYGSEKYGSRYQGQRGPTPSRSYANFHRTQL